MVNVSKNDYKILQILHENDSNTEMKSLTINRLKELTKLSENKIRDTLKTFQLLGYLKEGALQNKAKTYYITILGEEKLKTL